MSSGPSSGSKRRSEWCAENGCFPTGQLEKCCISSEATVSHIKRSLTVASQRVCDNSLYGFKGAPPARHARAEPAQKDRELKTRSAGEECVSECEHDHLVLIGE
jgi:hypothetical protein